MIKNKFLLFAVFTLLFSACAPINNVDDGAEGDKEQEPIIPDIPEDDPEDDPKEDDPPEEKPETYNDIYELKTGYTKDDLQGGPIWMNSTISGDVAKINKPKLTDDFYTYTNYESLIDETPALFDITEQNIVKNFFGLTSIEESEVKNKGLLSEASSRVYLGEQENVHNKIYNLMENGVSDFLLSKEAMEMDSGPFYIEYSKSDNNFKLGYQLDDVEIQYRGLSFLSYLVNYYNWVYEYYGESYITYKEYADRYELGLRSALKELYIGAGFNDENVYESYINLGMEAEENLFEAIKNNLYSNSRYIYKVTNVSRYSAYLTDYFNVNSDLANSFNDINISFVTKRFEMDALNYIYNHREEDSIKALVINRVLFNYRFMLGYENYKNAGKVLAELRITNDFKYSDIDEKDTITMWQTYGLIHDAVDNSYINKYYDEEKTNKIDKLIKDIRNEYKEILKDASWLSKTTQDKAIEKLDAMKTYIGFPESIKTDYLEINKTEYSSLFDVYQTYLDNKLEIALNKIELDFDIFDQMTVLTVNAFNSPNNNAIVILQGIMEGNIFGENNEEGALAVIGVIIGHEISHSFDVSGAEYDKNGNYNNWWTKEDKENFKARADKITNYFSKVEAINDVYCDGQNMNGEASSDMGGVKVTLRLAKNIPNFDYDSYFTQFAKMWSTTRPLKDMNERIKNEHPLEYLRVNVTLSQFDEFIETYDIKPGDKMYVAKEDRIAIW